MVAALLEHRYQQTASDTTRTHGTNYPESTLAEQHDDWIQQKRYMSLSALEQTKQLMHRADQIGGNYGVQHQLTA